MRSHSDWIKVTAFRPDGRTLATAGADGRIRLWDVAAGGRPQDLPERLPSLYTLAYSRDGQMLAAAGFSDKIWVFDGQQGSAARELAAPGSDIRAVAFSPDGTRMAAAGRAGRGPHLGQSERAAAGRCAGLDAAHLPPSAIRPTESCWPRPANSGSSVC